LRCCSIAKHVRNRSNERRGHYNDHVRSNKHKRKASLATAEAAVKKPRLQESSDQASIDAITSNETHLKRVYCGLKNVFEIHRAEFGDLNSATDLNAAYGSLSGECASLVDQKIAVKNGVRVQLR